MWGWTGELVESYGMVAVFLLMTSNGFLSVPPSEAVLATAGALSANGHLSFLQVFIASVVGNLSGAFILYCLGRARGYVWLKTLRSKAHDLGVPMAVLDLVLPSEKVVQAIAERATVVGTAWIGLARCLPVVRSMVSYPAGAANMPIFPFGMWTLAGVSVWSGVWCGIGYYFKSNWNKIGTPMSVVLIVILCLTVFLTARKIRRSMLVHS